MQNMGSNWESHIHSLVQLARDFYHILLRSNEGGKGDKNSNLLGADLVTDEKKKSDSYRLNCEIKCCVKVTFREFHSLSFFNATTNCK